MVITAPHEQELQKLLDASLYATLKKMLAAIESRYSLDTVWHTGGKKWAYELKFRKGSKTRCSLLFKESIFGVMVIFGKSEQTQFEARRGDFSHLTTKIYDAATTYKDGNKGGLPSLSTITLKLY